MPERIADMVHRWSTGAVQRVVPALDLDGARRAARVLLDALDGPVARRCPEAPIPAAGASAVERREVVHV
jgi:hypothetical protein